MSIGPYTLPAFPRGVASGRAVPAAVLAVAAVAWIVAVRRMDGMDMGVATELGPFGPFLAVWIPMMAAMMLPGATPAVSRHARRDRRLRAAPLFVGSYLAVWTLVGVAVFALYRPHGTAVAGALVVAAGLYGLAPAERAFRRRCRAACGSGVAYGLDCAGASAGAMAVLLALGAMSIVWMAFACALVAARKLLRPAAAIDVPLALALVVLGLVVAFEPSWIPGLVPSMPSM